MQISLQKNITTYLLIAVLGGVVATLMVTYCQDASCPAAGNAVFDAARNHLMLAQPLYFTWLIFMAITLVISFLFAGPLWFSFRQFRPFLTGRRLVDLILGSLICLVLLVIPDGFLGRTLGMDQPLPIYLFFLRVVVLLIVSYFCLLPAFMGLWMIRNAIEKEFAALDASSGEAGQVKFIDNHIRYRELSQRYLAALGLSITLAVLATGANREIGLAINLSPTRLPTPVILTYGLYFSLIVALLYAPTYMTLQSTGMALRDRLYPIQQIDKLDETIAKRKSFEGDLQLNISLEQNLRTGLIILSPLLTGILTVLIGK